MPYRIASASKTVPQKGPRLDCVRTQPTVAPIPVGALLAPEMRPGCELTRQSPPRVPVVPCRSTARSLECRSRSRPQCNRNDFVRLEQTKNTGQRLKPVINFTIYETVRRLDRNPYAQ